MIASASLKLVDQTSAALTKAGRFRGVIASASLKLLIRVPVQCGRFGFRGVIASASLKRGDVAVVDRGDMDDSEA